MTVRILLSLAIMVAGNLRPNSASCKAWRSGPWPYLGANSGWQRSRELLRPHYGNRFFPAISPNESLLARWNELVSRFAGQAVEFVWITSEYQPPLDRWMEQHPVSGCLLLDPLGATAKAYGAEFGAAIVDANGRVAGFTIHVARGKNRSKLFRKAARLP